MHTTSGVIGRRSILVFFVSNLFMLARSETAAGGPAAASASTAPAAHEVLDFDAMLQALESTEGFSGSTRSETAARAEVSLRPILAALPRNNDGNFEPATVRYALHRHFVRRYGWHMHGLDPQGSTWNSSSPLQAAILRRLPSAARSRIEGHLSHEGLSSSEVVGLAVTLEILVHLEALERLRLTYGILRMPTDVARSENVALRVAHAYMTSFLLSRNLSDTTSAQEVLMDITPIYPTWPQVKVFIHDLLASQRPILRRGKPMQFQEVMHLVEGIHHGFGGWLKTECGNLKKTLLEIEDHGTGTVLLSDFYTAGLNGTWQFQESVAYLKELGALDESQPDAPRVIVPNWVQGRSNCIGHTASYDTCCVSECEPLLAHIEQAIGAPAATPEDLAAIVAALPSDTVPVRAELSPLLLSRLRFIAAQHDGLVPIYGRLFAQ